MKQILNKIEEHKEGLSALLNIFGILSIFGLFTSFIIFYKYFNLHNLELQTPDNFVIAISIVWLIIYVTLLFSFIAVWIIGAGEELKDSNEGDLNKKDKSDLRFKLATKNIFKIIIFNILVFCLSYFFDNDDTLIVTILFLLMVVIFYVVGIKYTYNFSKKRKPILSSDYFIFLLISLFFYMFFIYDEKYTALPVMLFVPTLIIIYFLPFVYIEGADKTPMIKFVASIYGIVTFLFISFIPTVFLENTIRDLHLGNLYYKKLVLHKDECLRLNNYDLGYKCDENNTLSNIMGLWISSEKPIFQKSDTSSIKPKVDENSTKIWLNKDKIYSVL